MNLNNKFNHDINFNTTNLTSTKDEKIGLTQYTYQNTPGNAWTAKQQSVAIHTDDPSRIINSKSLISLKAIK